MESKKLNVLPTECSCDRCRFMCYAPCCPTPDDVIALIDAGYAKRLMLDDWPGEFNLIKPAMKGSEGEKAPWEVKTLRGCTFWTEDGSCELHDKGLKPFQGKLAHHDHTDEEVEWIAQRIKEAWESDKGEEVSALWKRTVKYKERNFFPEFC